MINLYVGKIDEVKNANFSFNNKSYIDALLQKVQVEEHVSEKLGKISVLQKGDILMQIATYKKHTENQPII